MNIEDGQLFRNNTQIMNEEEIKKATKSLKKFIEYEIETSITYHADLYNNKSNKKIKELVLGDLND
ncbi:MAG: hypothetical protein WCF28_02925 [Methanobacterium sp.]|uniref:hypothetical protein n=1 Tax=Methanobacterium sp. TaxID=2164 RepID=UPI003C77F6B2